jgi:hypothetical protein
MVAGKRIEKGRESYNEKTRFWANEWGWSIGEIA